MSCSSVVILGYTYAFEVRGMPLIIATLALSRILQRIIIGEDKRERRREMITYKEEFVHFFPNVLSVLVGRKTTTPRLRAAYDHLEKVCTTAIFGSCIYYLYFCSHSTTMHLKVSEYTHENVYIMM